MTLLLVYVFGALSVSFLCSILEAALLSVRGYELTARKDAGDQGAAILLELKEHRIDDAISAILTLNTIAHTVGAALAGAQAEKLFGDAWIGVFAAVLTVLVLLFTEIIPKTLGTVFAARLVGFVGRTLGVLILVLKPVLAVTRLLTGAIAHGKRRSVSRGDLKALAGMARRAGNLADRESRVLYNILQFEKLLVEDIMTPRTVVKMLEMHATVGDLLDDDEAQIYSRIPLFEETQDQVRGYVLHREILSAALKGAAREEPLADHLRPVRFIPENAMLNQVLEVFLEQREQLTLAVDEFGGVSGLVTIEDLIETILGAEILDELDAVADLREAAQSARKRRLARYYKERAELGSAVIAADPDDPDHRDHPVHPDQPDQPDQPAQAPADTGDGESPSEPPVEV